MTFHLEIDVDNAAFFGEEGYPDLSHIDVMLNDIGSQILRTNMQPGDVDASDPVQLRDYNGNTVGKFWFE
jgi:hypothetical protein